MATHSSILAWRIPGTEEPGGLAKSDRTERLFSFLLCFVDQREMRSADCPALW